MSLKMRHLLFLVAVAIVDVIIAIDHGGIWNNVDVDEFDALISSGEAPTGQDASVQYGEGQVTDAEDRGGNAGEERMSKVQDDVNRRTGNDAQEWMNNVRDDVNRRTESSCPRDFVYNAKLKFCFKVIFERSSTYSAKTKCQQMVNGGRLVQPDTRDKLMELTKYISSKNHGARSSFAIGSTKNRERDFTWMDGSPMKYAHWCPGSPNKGKPFVTLTSQRRGSDMCMDDGCCYHRGNFICEKPIAN